MFDIQSLALRASGQKIYLLDQQQLPAVETWLQINTPGDMISAIKKLQVRGAPLIGVSAALSLAQYALMGATRNELAAATDALYEARPTAVNLMNCMQRMKNKLQSIQNQNLQQDEVNLIVQEAVAIYREDFELCERIAANGAALISDGDNILTHCNTGSLATAGVGTALGVIDKAFRQGKKIHVYVDETRPLLQGGRLTAWELGKLGIPYTLITDNMAGHLMSLGKIQKAIVGSDRIAANGDFANKIGTYSVAVLCHFHKIPFFVAAPYTTVDLQCATGAQIPIEQRAAEEVLGVSGSFGTITWAPPQAKVYNPSFDVTPAKLVSAWILDKQVLTPADVLAGKLHEVGQN